VAATNITGASAVSAERRLGEKAAAAASAGRKPSETGAVSGTAADKPGEPIRPRYDFRGKVLFVTGAGQGFGRQFAQGFAAMGAAVAATDVNLSAAQQTAAAIERDGGRAVAFSCDVAQEASVSAAVAAAAEQLGGIDFLINNAGRHLPRYNQPFTTMPVADLRDLFEVNLMGVVFCSRACRPQMRSRGGGAIVNIASIAGHFASTPYGVSKLAVRGMTVALATELAVDNIRVNAISPGLIATESVLAELPAATLTSFRNERQLVHRQGEMADITAAALFLCSTSASFITGETLKVDGGYPLYI
jgi:NAD(P)-dependent dehydrogenase (short-subunit alcohol dehydrogenase family)